MKTVPVPHLRGRPVPTVPPSTKLAIQLAAALAPAFVTTGSGVDDVAHGAWQQALRMVDLMPERLAKRLNAADRAWMDLHEGKPS